MFDMMESNYCTENQGMMLSAMNAVTIWAIEQSIAPNVVKTGETSSEKAQNTLVVKVSDNSQSQIYGRGPESCVYWGELAKGADGFISEKLFSWSEEVCRNAEKLFKPLPEPWVRAVRACLQDFHEAFSRFFEISRYTYTFNEFVIANVLCFERLYFMYVLNTLNKSLM